MTSQYMYISQPNSALPVSVCASMSLPFETTVHAIHYDLMLFVPEIRIHASQPSIITIVVGYYCLMRIWGKVGVVGLNNVWSCGVI